MRINIQPADKYPIEFKDRSSEEFIAYHRVEDTTREMTPTDVVEFTESRTKDTQRENSGLRESVTIDQSELHVFDKSSPRKSPPNRAILNLNESVLIVPTRAHLGNSFQKSLTFHVEKRGESGIAGLKKLLEETNQELSADLGYGFGYGIRYGSKEIVGKTASNYLNDIKNLDETLRLLGGEGDNDPRPVAVGGTGCDFGFIWFQAQYHTGSLSRIKCGLVLSDIPVDTGPIEGVFPDEWFEQDNSVREFRLQTRGSEIPLSDTERVLFDESSSTGRMDIIADNPYYRNKDAIIESTDSETTKPFIDAICSVDRLPFDIRAGYSDEDIYYTVSDINMGYIHTVIPTYFVWALCNPHTERPSEDPPTPDLIESLASDQSTEQSKLLC